MPSPVELRPHSITLHHVLDEGRVTPLPFNIDAEKALLGALLIENRLLEEILLHLRDEHFYEPLHGRIFVQLKRLADLNMVAMTYLGKLPMTRIKFGYQKLCCNRLKSKQCCNISIVLFNAFLP